MQLQVKRLTVGVLAENCYLVFKANNANNKESSLSQESKQEQSNGGTTSGKQPAIIVDPGDDINYIMSFLDNNNLYIKSIILTHAHFDHISAVKHLNDFYNANVYLHEDDFELYYSTEKQSAYFNIPNYDVPFVSDKVKDRQTLFFLDSKVKVIHTPGHTKGSVCYHFVDHNILFTGDTLFKDSIGRVDLPTGNKDDMLESLKKLLKLPDETTIYPGHMDSSTISHEKLHNPYLSSKFFF